MKTLPDNVLNLENIARSLEIKVNELREENESLYKDLKLINTCWQTDMKQIRDLEASNKELLEALRRALNDFQKQSWTNETYSIIESTINKASKL